MPWNHKEADFQWKSSQHSHTYTRTQHLKIPTYKTLTLIYECVCVFLLIHSLMLYSFFCNQNKICQRPKCFGDCSTVDLAMLYSIHIPYWIYIYIHTNFLWKERQFLITLHVGLVLLRTNRSLSFVATKMRRRKKKQIKTTKLLEMCVFRFSIYVRSSLDLFIYSFCVTKCCRYGTKLNRRKNKTCFFFYAEESLRIPTNAISGSKFFGKKKFKVNVTCDRLIVLIVSWVWREYQWMKRGRTVHLSNTNLRFSDEISIWANNA